MIIALRTGASGLPYRHDELADKRNRRRVFRHYAIFDRYQGQSKRIGNAWGFNMAEALREFRQEQQGKTE